MTPLEDSHLDLIDKARAGLGLSATGLTREAGLDAGAWARLRSGDMDAEALTRVARVLGLDGPALLRLARGEYAPPDRGMDGLRRFESSFSMAGFSGLRVNAYVVWDPVTRHAAIFDSGTDAGAMLAFIREKALEIVRIFLTHTHHDHVEALAELLPALGRPPVHVHEREAFSGATAILEGTRFRVGGLDVEARLTSGHSPGGLTYVVRGLEHPLALVGDALYAGSAGGARGHWRLALEAVEREILSLPGDTILCAGHGPLTTVAFERANNPLFCGAR